MSVAYKGFLIKRGQKVKVKERNQAVSHELDELDMF
jgi:hypothetical protein